MATDSGKLTAEKAISFEAEGGLFGADQWGIDWGAFLGIGGTNPIRAPFNLGGAVSAWLPFKGDTEVLRLQLIGEIATRIGLDVALQVNAGETRAKLPYEVAFTYPDADVLAASPYFRLEGEGIYKQGTDAGFETDWPYFMFSVDAVFELAVLAQLVAGILGDNKTYDLLDFDFATVLPLIDLDTRPDDELPPGANTIFGVDLDTLDGEATVDYQQSVDTGAKITNGTSISADFKADGVDFAFAEPDPDRTGGSKDGTDTDVSKTSDKKDLSTLQKLDQALNGGALATLTVNLPSIELEEHGTKDEDLGLFEEVSYLDGTRRAFDYGDGTAADRTAAEMADREAYINDVVNLNIDMDNILVELIKRVITGGTGAPVVPGLEGEFKLPMDFGPLNAGLDFGYNLFDADLEFSLPINQTVEVTPEPLKTSLSFYAADLNGDVMVDTDGVREATFITARLPRYSVYFNEANTFWDEGVAEDLQAAQLAAVEDSTRVANDLALFVDFEGKKLPGGFTGQTGSVSGGVVTSTDGGQTWTQLTTNAEETEYLARSRAFFGNEPDLTKLVPRDDALFKYVIYTDDTQVSTSGAVTLSTAFSHRDLDFSQLVGPDGIFEAQLDVVTAPLYTTGLLEGVPSLDLYFPGIPNESIWVEVMHEAAAAVRNDTSLDFNIDIILSALEFNLSAWVSAFGARLGLDLDFGPLWTKTYPIFATELAKLYDNTFEISTQGFLVEGDPVTLDADGNEVTTDAWGFAIGAGGAPTVLVDDGTNADDTIDGAAVQGNPSVNGRGGTDTITYAKVSSTDGIIAALTPDPEAATYSIQLTPDTAQQAGAVHIDRSYATSGLSFNTHFSAVIDGPSSLLAEGFGLVIRSASDGPSVGDSGGYMGYGLASGGPANTVGVMFDTHPSTDLGFSDPSGNRVELIRDGDLQNWLAYADIATSTVDFDDRTEHFYWVSYDAGRLKVWISRTDTQPVSPYIDLALDLEAIVGPRAIFGMTASTGLDSATSRHELVSWEMEVNGQSEFDLKDLILADDLTVQGDASILTESGQLLVNIENINGTRGDDTLFGDGAINVLDGGEGDDVLDGKAGADTLIGGIGNDILYMSTGAGTAGAPTEVLLGGEGEDRLVAGFGYGLLDGGEDAPVGIGLQDPSDLDIVDYRNAPGAINANFDTNTFSGAWISRHQLKNLEGLAATAYDDTLTGDAGRSYFEAGDGNDYLLGDAIPTGLSQKEGLALEGGNDRLYGQGGNDTLIGGPGADMLDGGDGTDMVSYEYAPTSVFVDLAAGIQIDSALFAPLLQGTGSDEIDFFRIDGQGWRGWAQGDKFRDIEHVTGSDYEDILFGDAGRNAFWGGDGDDRLTGRGSANTIFAGNGDDVIWTAAQNVEIEARFTPENTRSTYGATSGSPLLLKTSNAFDVDVVFGGNGDDLSILDWDGKLSFVQSNELVEIYDDGSRAFVPYQLRYEAQGLDARLVGSLTRGVGELELGVQTIGTDDFLVTSYSRDGGPWQTPSFIDTAQFLFEDIRAGDPTIEAYGVRGSYFRDEPYSLQINGTVRVEIADLRSIEGLIGSTSEDFLTGTSGDDSLYGNGGADLIGASGGDDIVSFGEGQPASQIFSFPGRGYDNVLAIGTLGGLTAWQDTSQPPLNPGDTLNYDWAGGGVGGSIPADLPAVRTPVVRDNDAANSALASYAQTTNGNGSGLDALRDDLIAIDSRYATHAIVEGGNGEDTLDLRYDRGLDFLPRDHARGAYVNFVEMFGHVANTNSLLFGFENIVGTDASDFLIGDEADNIIEGGAGTDDLRGGDGIDTLSYANADDGVTFILGETSSNAGYLIARKGDALFDTVTEFEVLRGSEHSDTLGMRQLDTARGDLVSTFATSASNDFQIIDGGGGDDDITAAQRGVRFIGDTGDDTFHLLDLDWISDLGDTTEGIVVNGGAGVDRVIVDGDDLSAVSTSGNVTKLAFRGTNAAGAAENLNVFMNGVEYIETATQTVKLDNLDPVVGAVSTLWLPEDPWITRKVFPSDDPSTLPVQGGSVIAVSEAGTFHYTLGAGRVDVVAGMQLSRAMIAALQFDPDQEFGLPLGAGTSANPVLTGASLELRYVVRDANGAPVLDSDGNQVLQDRRITVLPGDLEGRSLGLATPTDVANTPRSVEFGKLFNEESQPANTVRLGAIDNEVYLPAITTAEANLTAAQAAEDLAQSNLDDAEDDLARFDGLSSFQRALLSAQIRTAEAIVAVREVQLTQAQTVVVAREQELADAEAFAAANVERISGYVPDSRLGDAQSFEVTDIAEGGTLWLAENWTLTAADAVYVREIKVGDYVAQPDLDKLAFLRESGVVQDEDFVSLAPVEHLEVRVTELPDAGFVFSAVSEPGFAAPVADPDVQYTLEEDPSDGVLFYRDEKGQRVEVQADDVIDASTLGQLQFYADDARRATITSASELEAEIARLNAPTLDTGTAGVGSSAVPPDPTALALRLKVDVERADVDGVTINLENVGEAQALPFATNPGLSSSVDWVQWTRAEGGNDHFYAFADLKIANSEANIDAKILEWNLGVSSGPSAAGAQLLTMASIGSADENEFIWSLFGNDQDNFSARFGPRLGASLSNGNWAWDDKSAWDLTFWSPGEPNNVSGQETSLHYVLPANFADFSLVPPLWNDLAPTTDAPGFIVEVAAMTTDRNDSVTGSAGGDTIDGGAGDDYLFGAGDDDNLRGGSGNDVIEGGDGDDTLTGGAGNDIFVLDRNSGVDVITDFAAGDRLDVEGLGLLGLSELRMEVSGSDVSLHASGYTVLIEGVTTADLSDPSVFVGGTVFVGAMVEDVYDRALSVGDILHVDELADLRYRAPLDFNGQAGGFKYEVLDPWALEGDLTELGGSDPRIARRDGIAEGGIDFRLSARNDAPRSDDRAYMVSAGSSLVADDSEIALSAIDPEGDAVTFSLVTGPSHGVLELFSDGTFIYTPTAGYVGELDVAADDGFTFLVSDGTASTTHTVSFDVQDTSALRSAEPGDTPNSEGYIEIGGMTSDDVLGGTAGKDHIIAGHGRDRVTAKGGDDKVEGGSGNDTLDGGAGNDLISDGSGNDTVRGGAGDDTLEGWEGQDRYDGGSGTDTLMIDLSGLNRRQYVVETNLFNGYHGIKGAAASRDVLVGIENYTFMGDFNNEVVGDAGDNGIITDMGVDKLEAGAGNDTVYAGNGNDRIFGQGGADLLFGQTGDDYLDGSFADDFLFGGSGNDTLMGGLSNDQLFGQGGADQMDGGENSDVYIIDALDRITDSGTTGYDKAQINVTGGLSVSMSGWTGVERVNGFTGNDTINGASQKVAILLSGDAGNDSLTGGSADDVLIGGAGNDTMTGGAGRDFLLGNTGNDLFDGGAGNDVFFIGEAGDVVSNGGAGFDKAVVTTTTGLAINIGSWVGVERFNGHNGNDTINAAGMSTGITLVGSGGNDTITGGSAGDTFYGGQGADRLFGGGGADAMIGSAGNDFLEGGAGNDFYLGGVGADSFAFNANFGKDAVRDYLDGVDRLDFTGHAGVVSLADLDISQAGAHTILSLAAGGGDQITLVGVSASTIGASDFDFV